MTNRDYANSQPKKRPAKRTRGGRKVPPPRRFPIILMVFVICAVVGFGYFLWNIKDSSNAAESEVIKKPAATPAVAEKTTKTKPKPKATAEGDLPPKPKEEWTYLEELKNKKVEVDIPEGDGKPKRPYQMQCGSFRHESQANEMKAVIAFQGLEAQVRKTSGAKGTWYKVVLGPYDRKREAERHRHILQKAGMNGCQIWYWEG